MATCKHSIHLDDFSAADCSRPRDGRNISILQLIKGLKEGYGLSTSLAVIMTVIANSMVGRFTNVSLIDYAIHGRIEHNASLVHVDTPLGQKYAPIEVHSDLVDLLVHDGQIGHEKRGGGPGRILMDASDFARARVRREKESPPLDYLHSRLGRGEAGLILGVWKVKDGENVGVPVEVIRTWMQDERLPGGWKPTRVLGLLEVQKGTKAVEVAMEEQRGAEMKEKNKS